ncbi:MAG: site-specific DNA-methyltransferase [Mycoplasma sp.]|nr:site-specific DNA-methyltransferase [Mycoplasma sp.]
MNLREEYKKKIDELAKANFNKDQKKLAKDMLDKADDHELTNWYQLIIQRVKKGFVFDAAPEVFQGSVSILSENVDKRINVNDEVFEDENKLIIGENYDSLKNLLLTHKGAIDVIYIDPPYNTEKTKEDGNELKSEENAYTGKFIYRDKFARTGWLNIMNERLLLAKQLLSNDGVIFVSIDDIEQAYLKVLMDEIFGEENFITSFIWERTHHSNKSNSGKKVFRNVDYIHAYTKSHSFLKIFTEGKQTEFGDAPLFNKTNRLQKLTFPKNKVFLKKENKFNDRDLIIEFNSRWSQSKINDEIELGTTFIIKGQNPKAIRAIYHNNKEGYKIPNQLLNTSSSFIDNFNYVTTENGTSTLKKILGDNKFSYPKPHELIKYLINLKQNKDILVLDFFAGSGTTGQAVMELNRDDGGNRKFILCTNNENYIADKVTYERLHRIIKGKSTTNEKEDFPWIIKNKPFEDAKLRVFNVESHKCSLDDDISSLEFKARQGLKMMNKNYSSSEIDLLHDLNSLHPLEKK